MRCRSRLASRAGDYSHQVGLCILRLVRISNTSIVVASQILLFTLLAAYCPRTAMAQESKINEEFFAFTGGSMHPHAGSLIGGSYGMGFGKNMFSFEASHQYLGDYALGLARSFVPLLGLQAVQPFGSSVVDISGNYQRDLFGHNPLLFGTIGFGGTWSHFTAVTPCVDCFGPPTLTESYGIAAPKVGGGIGVRVPVWKSLGIRTDFKYWYIPAEGSIDIGSRCCRFPIGKDELIRLTIGISIRHKYNGWLR